MQKTWVRVIVSMLSGGVVSEAIHVSTGDPDRPQEINLSLLYAALIYAILTLFVKRSNKRAAAKGIKPDSVL